MLISRKTSTNDGTPMVCGEQYSVCRWARPTKLVIGGPGPLYFIITPQSAWHWVA